MDNYYKLVDSTDGKHLEFVGNFTNLQPNDISIVFFSNNTIDKINIELKNIVKEKTQNLYGKKFVIEDQKRDHLLIVMRYIYFKFVNYEDTTDNEVEMLVNKLLEYVLPTILSGLDSQLKYLDSLDKNRYVEPLANPQVSRKKKSNLPPRFMF